MGEGFQPRLVFGWPALREKLLCASLSLNDVDLELLKWLSCAASLARRSTGG